MSHIDARVGERDKSAEVDINFELPIKSVTESIVNSICHRDYTSNGSVQVMLFPDRLEVDMVNECVAMGLKAPEFIQDSNFRAILWRENAPSSIKNALTSEKNAPSSIENALTSDENALSSTIKLNKKQKMVLDYCAVYARTSNEIFTHLGITNQSRSREKYITQLILAGLLHPTKSKSTAPDQKYIATAGSDSVNNDND